MFFSTPAVSKPQWGGALGGAWSCNVVHGGVLKGALKGIRIAAMPSNPFAARPPIPQKKTTFEAGPGGILQSVLPGIN